MKIVHISNPVEIPPKNYGGTERVVYNLAKIQAEKGHDVTVIAGSPSVIPGVEDQSFVKGKNYHEKTSIPERFITGYAWKAYRKANKLDADIVHNHISEEAITYSSLCSHPVVSTLHCPMTLERFWPHVTTSITKHLPKKTKFISISRRSLRKYSPYYGDSLISYVHSGIDITNIPFKWMPENEHEVQICFLNKFVPEKQPQLALEVADILYERGVDVKLVMMGKIDPDDAFGAEVKSLCDKRDYVDLLANVPTDQMFNLLGNSHVMVNPSVEIGLNLAQLEALSTGTPVVGVSDGVAEEVVVYGENGFIGESPEKLADYCLKARKLDRVSCRRYVEKEFSLEQMYQRYEESYSKVM